MTTFRIPKGKHRAKPWRFWIGTRRGFYWRVTFYDSCRYTPDAENDANKLIGFGFLPGHHKNSARFGWRMHPDGVELCAYVYTHGKRFIQSLRVVPYDVSYMLSIMHEGDSYEFYIDSQWYGTFPGVDKSWKYRLGLWFGGQATAPHEMKVKIESLWH